MRRTHFKKMMLPSWSQLAIKKWTTLFFLLPRCRQCCRTFLITLSLQAAAKTYTEYVAEPINVMALRPSGLTFTGWRHCDLCQRHEPTELVHSFLVCSCVYFCLDGPFNCISFHKFSCQLSAFSLCSSGLNSAVLVLSTLQISSWKSPSALI